MLRSGGKGGVAIATPDGGEVSGGIAEAGAKMCASLNSDRLFGVVNNETETCVDEKGAPLGLKIVWEGVKKGDRGKRLIRGSGCHHLVELGLASEGGKHEAHPVDGALEIEVVLVDNVRVDGNFAVRRKGYLTLQNLGKGVIGVNVGFEWGITGQRVRHASS